jgi:hypothetical protein
VIGATRVDVLVPTRDRPAALPVTTVPDRQVNAYDMIVDAGEHQSATG